MFPSSDPEAPVALDEFEEALGRDRATAADVGVVGGDVREPVGRPVRHQHDGGPVHAGTGAAVRSRTSAASLVSASGSVSGRTP